MAEDGNEEIMFICKCSGARGPPSPAGRVTCTSGLCVEKSCLLLDGIFPVTKNHGV